MSSRDKPASSNSRASSRPSTSTSSSHKPPAQTTSHRQSSSAGGSKHAPTSRNTPNNAAKNSGTTKKTTLEPHRRTQGKQVASSIQASVSGGSASKGLQKFTKKLQQIDCSGESNSKNLNEMATTSHHFTSSSSSSSNNKKGKENLLLLDEETLGEQETDVDDEFSSAESTSKNINDSQENDDADESTNLIQLASESDQRGQNALEERQGDDDMRRLQEDPRVAAAAPPPESRGDSLPAGWEQHSDKAGPYFWHVSTGVIQRTRPSSELPSRRGSSVVVYHDDEEINQDQAGAGGLTRGPSSDTEDTNTDGYYESGAALTIDDTTTATASETTFVVYPLGCCEFDETQLVSATSGSRAILKCILRLSNRPQTVTGGGSGGGGGSGELDEGCCWGLSQSEPILMRLFDDHIQFKDLKSQLLLRSQPIQTIKIWAVDDNNNFAFVIEDRAHESGRAQVAAAGGDATEDDDDDDDDATMMSTTNYRYYETVDYALLSEPILRCYVFRSADEDDMMSCKVAAKLNEEINRYKEQMINRISKSTRLQQMVEVPGDGGGGGTTASDDENADDDDDLEASNELTMNVKYIGKLTVPRPTGIDVLNVAIDKCLAEATTRAVQQQQMDEANDENLAPLVEAKLHVSPSSVIVESVTTGEIIVECRIRFLTFMGISKRDIRWCGFIMQNATNKTFVAHCFECHPTAGHVCEAIQLSCSRMYEKIVKNSQQNPAETISIIPSGSKIRNTLAKTLSRIKLNPLSR